jgi:signal transduction histidine kinase/AraC-like DNA-binding protein
MKKMLLNLQIRNHRYCGFFRVIALLLIFSSCSRHDRKEFTIGFSQCVESDAWRKTMLEGMKRELSFHPSITLIYRQADANTEKQISQVRELLQQKIDLLIISPNEAEPLTPVVEEAFNKGIPVIVVDRKISTPLYTAYVGGDNYEVGKTAGQYASHLLNGKGKIIEVTGLPKSSPAIERSNGFSDALKNYPSIRIVKQVNGQWLKQTAESEFSKIANQYPDVDLIFAHNDMMASGIYEVHKNKGITPIPKIIGVDGLPGNGAGMQFVANKLITATLLYPTGGQEAIRTALQILNKEDFKRDNILQTTVIDSTNVRYMQLQANKIGTQQQSIERQQTMLSDLKAIYNHQRTFLYILFFLLVIAFALVGLIFHYLRVNRRINRKLQWKNNEIIAQKNKLEVQKLELEEMSSKAQMANEAKVKFFTNISHEFRTPLTLILGPLEELISHTKNTVGQNRNLHLIHKNVIRLLRLINQLIDFRKIEVDKMRLGISQNDLITFVSEILASYQPIANKRNIDLQLITHESQVNLWFDANMLDKVFFNLLSNAFKFTKDNGYIYVYIEKNEDDHNIIVKVEDSGVGMEEESVINTFNAFYQGEYENQKGSGLGLALSKEIVKLHKGTISVRSVKWKGTTFEIQLPLGKEHLKDADIAESLNTPYTFYENEKIYTTDLNTDISDMEVESPIHATEYSILIIEDNEDLRTFLKNRLCAHYEILEAGNGQSALQQGFDTVPDLIIADVVIPGKNGLELVNIFKMDIRTSHIPIILLTGKATIENQIEGIKCGADAYITKPFNVDFLEQTIKSLISNRVILKEHFTSELPNNLKTQTVNKIDRKFVNEFTALVESNISNEHFTVEDICKNMGISRIQLYRKVKALLNVNVNDYILNIRLQKAKYLLQHEEFNISEIAYKVGFSSPAYFSTVFKSKFQVTPKVFREQ